MSGIGQDNAYTRRIKRNMARIKRDPNYGRMLFGLPPLPTNQSGAKKKGTP